MGNLFRQQLEVNQRDVRVERKAMVASDQLELHFYETLETATDLKLQFEQPIIGVMLSGEKDMEMSDLGRFRYLPGETLIVPAQEQLTIDFPNASPKNPTQCLAIIPQPKLIEEAVWDFSNKSVALTDGTEETIDFSADLLMRDSSILRPVNSLVYLFQENHDYRDLFINMAIKELIIRVLQSKARHVFLENFCAHENRMSRIVQYIRANISRPITIPELLQVASMSRTHFFSSFKETFGMTPNEFIIKEKITKAKALIHAASYKSITQIAYHLGYSDSSYFSKQFKNITGVTPRQYESRIARPPEKNGLKRN